MPVRRMGRMRGRGVLDWLRKAHDFIKKNKLVSRIGSSLGAVGVPYAGAIGKAGGILGYGRRRRVGRPRVRRVATVRTVTVRRVGRPRKVRTVRKVYGGALRLSGGALAPSGGRRRTYRRRR